MHRWRQWDVEIVSALMILLAGLFLWSASGCDPDSDGDRWEPPWPTWGVSGTVYKCTGDPDEFCWAGDPADVDRLTGEECHPITINERAWPALTGCRYACPPPGPGCNAHGGCLCEAP